MAGHRPFKELHDKLVARVGAEEVEAAYEQAKAEQVAYEATLAEVRRARNLTQHQLAKVLDVSQAQVSRIEHQADLYLSTLNSYVTAMGGELELVGVFDGQRVVLSLADVAGERDE